MGAITLGIFLCFLAAFFKTGKSVTTKVAATETDEYITSFATRVVAVAFAALLIALIGSVSIPTAPEFWLFFLLNVASSTATIIYLTRGFKLADVSIAAALLAFVPVSTMFPAMIVLGQIPTLISGTGVVLVTVGAYVLNLHERNEGVFEPIRAIIFDPGARAIMIAVLVASPMPTLDVLGLQHTTELMWMGLTSIATATILLVIVSQKSSATVVETKNEWKILTIVGLFNALLVLTQLLAYAVIDVVYVQAIKRVSILCSIVVGYLWFNEGHVRQRLLGGVIMIVGVFLIVFGL